LNVEFPSTALFASPMARPLRIEYPVAVKSQAMGLPSDFDGRTLIVTPYFWSALLFVDLPERHGFVVLVHYGAAGHWH
jgi:hypothetical protein